MRHSNDIRASLQASERAVKSLSCNETKASAQVRVRLNNRPTVQQLPRTPRSPVDKVPSCGNASANCSPAIRGSRILKPMPSITVNQVEGVNLPMIIC